MKSPLLAVLAILTTSHALAAEPDLVQCQWPSGQPMELRLCEQMRQAEIRRLMEVDRQATLQAQRKAAIDAATEQRRQAEAAQRERDEADNQARLQRQAADDAARKRAWDEERQREQAEEDRQSKAVAARRAACGADFGTPAVGMTLQRVQQCVGAFRLQGETRTAVGTVKTYVGARTVLHVADGKVASWARY